MEDIPGRHTIWFPSEQLLKAVRWLAKALSAERIRPALETISRHGDALVACNGWFIHAMEVPDGWPEGRFIRPIFIPPSSKGPLVLQVEDDLIQSYPDFDGILPNPKTAVAEIAVNARALRDALTLFLQMIPQGYRGDGGAVLLRFYGTSAEDGRPMELCSGVDGGPYALLMPMHYHQPERAWRPKFEPIAKEEKGAPEAESPEPTKAEEAKPDTTIRPASDEGTSESSPGTVADTTPNAGD